MKPRLLRNTGVNCYLDTTLQCILLKDEVVKEIRNYENDKCIKPQEYNISVSFCILLIDSLIYNIYIRDGQKCPCRTSGLALGIRIISLIQELLEIIF